MNTRKLLIPLATMSVAAAVTVGSGATFTSTTESSVDVTAGSIIHTNTADGVTLTAVGLLPGQAVTGELQIENTGDLDAVLTIQRTSAASSFANLKLTITDVEAGNPVFAQAPFPTGGELTPTELDGTFVPDETHTYEFKLELVDGLTINDDQGKNATATFEFKTVPVDDDALPDITTDWPDWLSVP